VHEGQDHVPRSPALGGGADRAARGALDGQREVLAGGVGVPGDRAESRYGPAAHLAVALGDVVVLSAVRRGADDLRGVEDGEQLSVALDAQGERRRIRVGEGWGSVGQVGAGREQGHDEDEASTEMT
jgi:hypothetical protein